MTQMMPQKSWAQGLCVFGAPCGGFFFPSERLQSRLLEVLRCGGGFPAYLFLSLIYGRLESPPHIN
jgi:hypothetical protein